MDRMRDAFYRAADAAYDPRAVLALLIAFLVLYALDSHFSRAFHVERPGPISTPPPSQRAAR